MDFPGVWLKKNKEKMLIKKHQWIFSGAIEKIDKNVQSGYVVCVFDYSNQPLCTAFYHDSNISLRVISFTCNAPDAEFWYNRIYDACILRQAFGLPGKLTNAYRLFHGEGDQISGLIIDIYHVVAVIQTHHDGFQPYIHFICEALLKVFQDKIQIILHRDESLSGNQRAESSRILYNSSSVPKPSVIISENGYSFEVDFMRGQKTGFFLDQRDNRVISENLAKGRNVLNCFCFTGGFSIYAGGGGATSVTSIDVSQSALQFLNNNIEINKARTQAHFETLKADVMEFLKFVKPGQYDMMIVDPPAFAKTLSRRHNAIMAYKRLNSMAISKIKKGGIILTFSCSQVVDTALFTHTITAAAMESGREVRIAGRLSQAPDHPVNIFHQETLYLKGLLLYVTH
ncbi:MAG TPA: class I SAM-dependent rRNA methyltransferase [Saprospiraceae bacterium]|nr:class I SAM-dependent rRNA methyltransferase [Saprospiraceae bacterium]